MKLDLHTHCLEATRYMPASVETVEEIVAAVKASGMDGIAITEHDNKEYGYKVKEIVERSFGNEIVIIPGQEILIRLERFYEEIVELYLPDGSTFRFVAHPVHSANLVINSGEFQGIEVANSWHGTEINAEEVRKLAERYDLLLLSNSDAHYLKHIGRVYNEIELEELCVRARAGTPLRNIL